MKLKENYMGTFFNIKISKKIFFFTRLLSISSCTVASESIARFKINAKNSKILLILIKIYIKNNF
jgi:hypothetical protein